MDTDTPPATVTFEPRASGRSQLIAIPIGIVAMLGIAAVVYLSGRQDGNVLVILTAVVPIVVAVGLALQFFVARRLARPGMDRVAVGPDGIQLPAIGLVPWPEIRDVSVETIVRSDEGSSEAPTTSRRIGIVTSDAVRRRLPWPVRAVRGLTGWVRSIGAPDTAAAEGRAALIGIGEHEVKVPIAEVVAAIRGYREVRDPAASEVVVPAEKWFDQISLE